jgi:membrane-associated phospholipid phosphatase
MGSKMWRMKQNTETNCEHPFYIQPMGRSGTYATFLFVWFILLMPVPFARVILNDHSITQVLLGSLIGLGEGFLWILLIQYLTTHKEHSPLFNSNQ